MNWITACTGTFLIMVIFQSEQFYGQQLKLTREQVSGEEVKGIPSMECHSGSIFVFLVLWDSYFLTRVDFIRIFDDFSVCFKNPRVKFVVTIEFFGYG